MRNSILKVFLLAVLFGVLIGTVAFATVLEGYDSNKKRLPFLVGSSGEVVTTSSATSPDVARLNLAPWDKSDDDAVANCVGITNASVQFTLPGSAGDWYCMIAIGNTAYVNCGSNPTATTTVTTGYAFPVPSGARHCRRLTGTKCAVIGTTGTGALCFEHLNPLL